MTAHTLLLTPWMSVHRIVTWQEAVTLKHVGKVDVLEEYDETVRSPSVTMYIPAVLRLRRQVPPVKRGVKFSRINVMTRDNMTCQFCGVKKPMSSLNYDHVIPRDQGGRTDWTNIVTSCYACNRKKANRTPAQAGMRLLKQPVRPKSLPLAMPVLPREIPQLWEPYLQVAYAMTA